jgi:hypothetical protein
MVPIAEFRWKLLASMSYVFLNVRKDIFSKKAQPKDQHHRF